MELVDTHCHIQSIGANSDDFTVQKWQKAGVDNVDEVIKSAELASVTRLICVGTDLEDSQLAIDLANNRENCWASVGIHPHEAKKYKNDEILLREIRNIFDKNTFRQPSRLDEVQDEGEERTETYRRYDEGVPEPSAQQFAKSSGSVSDFVRKQGRAAGRVVAIGEVGLDYHYENSTREDQIKLLEFFLQLAQDQNLPVIFHVRDAHSDFWPVFDNFKNLRGVMHSFSAGTKILNQALERNLFVGLNGIMTFTKDVSQLTAAEAVPLKKLLLETDAPYLTPNPHRGIICKPENVYDVAKFLAGLRSETVEELSAQTTENARKLFDIA